MVEKDESLDAAPGTAYRSLPREEPPPALDAAILAAARSSVDTPAPRRWAKPVAIAAVLVLSVGVTLRISEERPDVQLRPVAPQATVPGAPQPSADAVDRPAPHAIAPSPERAPARQAKTQSAVAEKRDAVQPSAESGAEVASSPSRLEDRAPEPGERDPVQQNVPAAPVPSQNVFVPSPRADVAQSSRAPSAGATGAPSALAERSATRSAARLAAPAEAPEEWLKRIVELRAKGRDREADESLAEFRRRHPGFAIPPDLLQKIASPR